MLLSSLLAIAQNPYKPIYLHGQPYHVMVDESQNSDCIRKGDIHRFNGTIMMDGGSATAHVDNATVPDYHVTFSATSFSHFKIHATLLCNGATVSLGGTASIIARQSQSELSEVNFFSGKTALGSLERGPNLPPDPLRLHIVDALAANKSGAVCLDGSPPGFWMRHHSLPADRDRWVLYLQGGAWCDSPQSCAARATGHLGSSTQFSPTYPMEGVLDKSLKHNELFGSWNHGVQPWTEVATSVSTCCC